MLRHYAGNMPVCKFVAEEERWIMTNKTLRHMMEVLAECSL
jgi:hypothetical protein